MKTFTMVVFALTCFTLQAKEDWKYLFATENINKIKEIEGKYYAATDAGLFIVNRRNLNLKHHLTIADGLPSQRIEDIAVDSVGNIWIGTYDNGVAMKQSNGWFHIPIPSHNNSINLLYCLEFDEFDNLWIGTEGGLFKYVNGEWESHALSFSNQAVWDMHKDAASGDIYMASHQPYKLEGTEFIHYPIENNSANWNACIYYDNGKIYFGIDFQKFVIIENDTFTIYGAEVFPHSEFTEIEVMDSGEVWTSLNNGDIYKFADGVWTKVLQNEEYGLKSELYKNKIGDLLICKKDKIYKSNNIDETYIDLAAQIPDNYIDIKIDENKEILIESDYRLFKINGNNFELKEMKPLEGKEDYTEFETINFPDNSTGFFEYQTGNLHYKNQITNVFDPIKYGSYSRDFFVDSKGGYWVVTNKGLVYKNGEEITLFNQTNTPFQVSSAAYGAPSFYKVTEDRRKNIWVSSFEGLGQWNRASETWISHPVDNTISQILYNLYFDEQNVLWASGYATGLMSFDGENWKAFTEQNSNIPSNFVRDIFAYEDILLIATEGGLSFFDGTDFKTYNTETSAISSNNCNAIEQDGNGNIWIAHIKNNTQDYGGISIFNPNGITFSDNEFPQLNPPIVTSIILNEDLLFKTSVYPNPADKFINIDFNQFHQKFNAVQLIDIYGKIYFSKNISPGEEKLKIYTGDLADGIYMLNLNDGEHIKSSKIIIQ